MAGITTSGNPGMAHLPTGEAHKATDYRRLMATVAPELAGIGQVIGRHPLGTKVVVAIRTRKIDKRGNRRMVKLHRWQERTGTVAGTATHAGRDVFCRFARKVKTIMAALAGALLNHHVTEDQA